MAKKKTVRRYRRRKNEGRPTFWRAENEKQDLRNWHSVRYRSSRSNKLRRFDPRVKLIAEVYSKRSGKRVGYINQIKGGEPIARKFSTKARLLYHESRATPPGREKEVESGISFRIKYWEWIEDQIPEEVSEILNKEIRQKGDVNFVLKMHGRDNRGTPRDAVSSPYYDFREKNHKRWVLIIANRIVSALRDQEIRTSPKAHSKNSRYWYRGKNIAQWRFIKKYTVDLVFKRRGRAKKSRDYDITSD